MHELAESGVHPEAAGRIEGEIGLAGREGERVRTPQSVEITAAAQLGTRGLPCGSVLPDLIDQFPRRAPQR